MKKVIFDDIPSVKNGVVLLTLHLSSLSSCGKISCNGQPYYIPVQKSRLVIPFYASSLDDFELEKEDKISIESHKWEILGNIEYSDIETICGQFLEDSFNSIALKEKDCCAGKSIDSVIDGNFVYSIGNGSLKITSLFPEKKVVSSLENLGSSIRQIVLLQDGKHVFVSSRENGCFIINVENKLTPYIVSVYNSIEMATGICASGDYVFISNRQYGVEIVNVADPAKPYYVSVAGRGREAQSCIVHENLLYCGIWGLHSIDIYDVNNPNKPIFLQSIHLDGKGDGASVIRWKGRRLLIAGTGHHSGINAQAKQVGKEIIPALFYGQGNGIEVYDITDLDDVKWLSTSKIDGRYYYLECDYWGTRIAVTPDGRLLAYLINTLNGVYVYDITVPEAPVRLAHIYVPIPVNSSNYKYLESDNPVFCFPFDQKKETRSAVGSICVSSSFAVVSGTDTDLHVVEDKELFFPQYKPEKYKPAAEPDGSFLQVEQDLFHGMKSLFTKGQCYAICAYEKLFFVACGNEGILLIDKELNVIKKFNTHGFCFDVQVRDNKLFAAEGSAGLYVYNVSENGKSLSVSRFYTSEDGLIRSVRVSPRARFALIMCGGEVSEIISLESGKKLFSEQYTHLLYHRNLLSSPDCRYLCVSHSAGREIWFDCGINDDYEEPKMIMQNQKVLFPYFAGQEFLENDTILAVGKSKLINYVVGSSEEKRLSIYNSAPTREFLPLGMPSISGNLMVCCTRVDGTVGIVDISDLNNPKLIAKVKTKGHPDKALITEKYVFIPMGYCGLVRFDRPF